MELFTDSTAYSKCSDDSVTLASDVTMTVVYKKYPTVSRMLPVTMRSPRAWTYLHVAILCSVAELVSTVKNFRVP
jgi:hypothetical protein